MAQARVFSDPNPEGLRLVEHGYHVFPQWYPNVRAIVNRLGVRLIDFDRYHFLLPGSYPRKSLCVGRQAWP